MKLLWFFCNPHSITWLSENEKISPYGEEVQWGVGLNRIDLHLGTVSLFTCTYILIYLIEFSVIVFT